MMNRRLPITFAQISILNGLLLVFALVGCSSSNDTFSNSQTTASGRTAMGFSQFPDIAVPPGSRMDVERSLVLGARDDWIGRLSITTSKNPSEAYDFFQREMPKYRWQEITTVRSETSILTFTRNSRVATIRIQRKRFGGSLVDVTVSPLGKQGTQATPR